MINHISSCVITLTNFNSLYIYKKNTSASFNRWSGGKGVQADGKIFKKKQSSSSHYSSSCKVPLSPSAHAAQPENLTAACPFLQS